MLDVKSLSVQIDGLTAERHSLEQFETWFLEHAAGVHIWADDLTLEAVQMIEAHFDELRFGGLSRDEFVRELRNAAAFFLQVTKLLHC